MKKNESENSNRGNDKPTRAYKKRIKPDPLVSNDVRDIPDQKLSTYAVDLKYILEHFESRFKKRFGVSPEVPVKVVAILVSGLLKRHSRKGICRIIDLYFEDPTNESRVYHLPGILSSFSINKYLPKLRFNPMAYSNAEELNKDLY